MTRPCPPRLSLRTAHGFTLIELLVSITILMLVLGGGIAAYLNLNDRQQLITTAKQVQLYMRSAQKKARSGEKPTGCTQLQGYAVVIPTGAQPTMTLRAICLNGSYDRDSILFPMSVSVSTAVNMQFLVLQGGVGGFGTVTLNGSGGKQYVFSVDEGGQITEGQLQ